MNKREKVLAGATGLAGIVFVINQFVCGQEEAPPAAAGQQKTQQAVTTPQTDSLSKPLGLGLEAKQSQKPRPKIEFVTWRKDPFADAYRMVPLDTTGRNASEFVLRGIIRRAGEAYALIGDEILRSGETRGDLTVVEIGESHVVCRKTGKLITLYLREDEK